MEGAKRQDVCKRGREHNAEQNARELRSLSLPCMMMWTKSGGRIPLSRYTLTFFACSPSSEVRSGEALGESSFESLRERAEPSSF